MTKGTLIKRCEGEYRSDTWVISHKDKILLSLQVHSMYMYTHVPASKAGITCNCQKLRLYKSAVCSYLTLDLFITGLPISWVEKKLDTLATKFSNNGQVLLWQWTPVICACPGPLVASSSLLSPLCSRSCCVLRQPPKWPPGTLSWGSSPLGSHLLKPQPRGRQVTPISR